MSTRTDKSSAPPPPPGFGVRLRQRFAAARAGSSFATMLAIRDTTSEAQKSRLPQMAAALSYRTIFGMIPMIVVALVAVKAFFATEEDMAKVLGDAMRYAGLADISVKEEIQPDTAHWVTLAGAPVYLPPPETLAAAREAPPPPASVESGRLDDWITNLVQRVGEIKWGTIGLIGLATLIYAALGMLVELERAFNQIYRVPTGRSWPRRITQYWTILTLGSLFLVATFYVGEQFKAWAVRVAEHQGFVEGGSEGITIALIGYGVTVAISTLLFLLMYTTIPNTKVQLRAAIAGALVAALLWEAGKWGFTQYVRFSASASYARLYGSIALIPLFLLWVYFTWLITLFGLHVAYQLQHVRQHTIAKPAEEIEPVIIDPSSILSIAGLLAHRFDKGEPATAREISERLAIRQPLAVRMLDQLVASSLAHKVEVATDEKAYTLARPPEKIAAEELLRVGEGMAGPADPDPDSVSSALRRSRLEFVQGKSLASLLGSNGALKGSVGEASPAALSLDAGANGSTAASPGGTGLSEPAQRLRERLAADPANPSSGPGPVVEENRPAQ